MDIKEYRAIKLNEFMADNPDALKQALRDAWRLPRRIKWARLKACLRHIFSR